MSGDWWECAEDRTERNDLGVGVEAHSDEQRLHDAIPHHANPQGQCEYREPGTPHQPGPQGCPRRDPSVDREGEPRRNQKEVAVTDDDRPRFDGRGKVEPEPVGIEMEHPRVIGRVRCPVHHRVQPRQTCRHRDHQQGRCRFAGPAGSHDRCSPDREKHDQRADLEVEVPVGDTEKLGPRRDERVSGRHPVPATLRLELRPAKATATTPTTIAPHASGVRCPNAQDSRCGSLVQRLLAEVMS